MFAHLHCHFFGSYSDSLLSPERDLPRVAEMGYRAIALTDHGELAFAYPFYRSCRSLGIRPVIGCEIYFVADAAAALARQDAYRNHLVLLAKNNEGFLNLVRLLNASWLENNYGEARGLVDFKLLERFHRGLIALTACFWGSIPQKYLTGGVEEQEKEFRRYHEIFGPDLHPELGRHGIPDEEKANAGLIELSRRHGLKPVVTNDCHYLLPEDWEVHDALIKTRFGFPSAFAIDSRDYWMKNEAQMRALGFPAEYYDHAGEVAEECLVDLDAIRGVPAAKPFDPEREAVFLARLNVIDARQALIDAAGARGEEEAETARALAFIPEGATIEEAVRGSAALAAYFVSRPRLEEVVRKLEGVPRSSEPDLDRVAAAPLSAIREVLQVKRSQGEVMLQYPGAVSDGLGVRCLPASALEGKNAIFDARLKSLRLLRSAQARYQARRYEEAAALFREVIAADPAHLDARYFLGLSFYSLGRPREAVGEFRILEEKGYTRRRLPRVLTMMGWAYRKLNDGPSARAAWERALVIQTNYPPPYYALGTLSFYERNFPAAKSFFSRFLELAPEGRNSEKARSLLRRIERRSP
ncbi:MAG: PHP domain-containing protein [Candidatus Aureabacteria bacterium]|nr:PHP domain-containing protein [Candidatus Auribacterota bacterium]